MKIILIGSGNIANHLGKAFAALGHSITQVFSKTLANATTLANVLSAQAIDDLDRLDQSADLYFIAVTDSAIVEVISELPIHLQGIILHCSGATSMDVLSIFKNHGVIYPIQSFSKQHTLDLSQTPFGIQANNELTLSAIRDLTSQISQEVFLCSSEQRLSIHIAAVFANNFSNAMYGIAYEILHQHQLPFELILPIIKETADKVQISAPKQVQTGPAQRNDKITMERHLQFISTNPDWQLIYQKISNLITKTRVNNS